MPEPYDFFATPRPSPPAPGAQGAAPAGSSPDPFAPPTASPGEFMTTTGPDPRFGPTPTSYAGPPQFGPPTRDFARSDAYGFAARPASRRPGTIVAASVLVFVEASVFAVAFVGLALAGFISSGTSHPVNDNLNSAVAGVAWFLAIIFGAIAGFLVFLGIQTLNGRRWAGITIVVLQGLQILDSLGSSTGIGYSSNSGATSVFGIVFAAAVIVLLAVPRSRAWLSR